MIRVKHPTLNSYTGISFNDFNNWKNMTILMDHMERGSLSLIIDTEQFEACQYGYDNTKRQIILVGICYGKMILHKNRILHRDSKPENGLIDDKYKPKLTNYGLTKIFDLHNIMSQPAAGYPIFTYMAPEVLRGNHFNPKSDDYSFGILMYEIIFGCRSFSDVIYKK